MSSNRITSFYGYTVSTDSNPFDANGFTNTCIFSITYPLHATDVEFTISSEPGDWGAQMGDGTIIPLKNPNVLFQNKSNSIVEFTMDNEYPSNSPCLLVYMNDHANMHIRSIESTRPFEMNSVTGYFAFTVDSEDPTLDYGKTKTLQVTIDYPLQRNNIKFEITEDPSHWGARMGDGSIIGLSNPVVVVTNRDNSIVRFTMDTEYPSNSPCVLVTRNANAHISVHQNYDDPITVPVEDIINMPTKLVTDVPFVLNNVKVLPVNASIQTLKWEVVDGKATVKNGLLRSSTDGNISIKCTIEKGLGTEDFTKTFEIEVYSNTITISNQPYPNSIVYLDKTEMNLFVGATSLTGEKVTYQWYENTENSNLGGNRIDGETASSFHVPNHTSGHFFYYCKISSDGAIDVNSNVSDVYVTPEITSIYVKEKPDVMNIGNHYTLTVDSEPAEADIPLVKWKSSDSNVANITPDGVVYVTNRGSGSVTFTASTVDGKYTCSCSININEWISVSDITNVMTEFDTDTDTPISCTVSPSNASVQEIHWEVIDAEDTGAVVKNHNIIHATNTGRIRVKGTIPLGTSVINDFSKEFVMTVNKKFIPVEDVELMFPEYMESGTTFAVGVKVIPEDATNTNVILTTNNSGAVFSDKLMTLTASGSFVVTATIQNGLTKTTDYTKQFSVLAHEKYVPVESIDGFPESLPNVQEPLQLQGTTNPTNSTEQNIEFRLISYPEGLDVSINDENQIIISNYETYEWYIENENPTPPNYDDTYISTIHDPIVVECKVKMGISRTKDYVIEKNIAITTPEPPSVFIAVTNITTEFPSIIRANRPLLYFRSFKKYPFNASASNGIKMIQNRLPDDGTPGRGGFMLSVDLRVGSSTYHPQSYYKDNYRVDFNKEYDWNLDEIYLYDTEEGTFEFVFTVPGGLNVEPYSYIKTMPVTFLPRYFSVTSISNIPDILYCNPDDHDFILDPQVISNDSTITDDNTWLWDEEIPSYTDIKWSLVEDNEENDLLVGTSITEDGTITTSMDDIFKKVTIRAEIEQGLHEAYTWYDKEFEAESYIQDFTILIEPDPNLVDFTVNTTLCEDETELTKWTYSIVEDDIVLTKYIGDDKNVIMYDSYTHLGKEYHTKINSISYLFKNNQTITRVIFGDNIDISQLTTLANLFNGCKNLEVVKFGTSFHSSTIAGMASLFRGCEQLYRINLDTFDTSNVTTMSYMFYGCKNLTTLDLKSFDTSKVENMNYMFYSCSRLSSIDLSLFDTSSVTNMSYMFNNCQALTSLDLSPFDVSKVTNMSYMFAYSDQLEMIYVDETKWNVSETCDILNMFQSCGVTEVTFKTTDPGETPTEPTDPPTGTEEEGNDSGVSTVAEGDIGDGTETDISNPDEPGIEELVVDNWYLIRLTLKDDSIVELKWFSQLSYICNHKENDYQIILGEKSFMKDDIKQIEFWTDQNRITPKSICSFGCNLTSLEHISEIPSTITGDKCLMNFLEGCISFNENINIPVGVTGNNCLNGFLNGCTSFNSQIIIPEGMSGVGIMKKFLRNCTSFNSELIIPNDVMGEQCLLRFMEGCTSFNQELVIPNDVKGNRCLDMFLRGCTSFNQKIKIPDNISGTANMRGFMLDAWNMCSEVSISSKAAKNCKCSGISFMSYKRASDSVKYGIPIVGTGADLFKSKYTSDHQDPLNHNLPVRVFN